MAEEGAIVTLTCALTVTNADAVLAGFATDCATRLKKGGLGGVIGAVYKPVESTVPQVVPTQPKPDTLQVTAVFCVPVTVAVNCCCAPVPTVACEGETVTPTELPDVTVTAAEAETVTSVRSVAVTDTVGGVGGIEGAV